MPILVQSIRPVQSGNLRAFVDIAIDNGDELGAVEIRSLRIIQQPGQKAFVQMPVSEYLDASGKRQFSPPIVKFLPAAKCRIEDTILAAWMSGEGRAHA